MGSALRTPGSAVRGKNWPLEKRERIADLLFSREADAQGDPQGIGLSIWRFNIGAGTAEQGDESGIRNVWRRAECFQKPDGTYDWTKQAGQQWFLQAARARGVEKFLAFVNAPPVHLAANGKGYAPSGYSGLNIKPGKIDEYAVFLVDVLERFAREGQPFDYLSPLHEPQWAWDEGKQEGTPARNIELYALVRCLSKELSRRNLSTRLVIGEAGTIGHAATLVSEDDRDDQAWFFFSPESPFYVGDWPGVERILSAHSYFTVWPLDKQVEYRQMLHEVLKSVNPPWATGKASIASSKKTARSAEEADATWVWKRPSSWRASFTTISPLPRRAPGNGGLRFRKWITRTDSFISTTDRKGKPVEWGHGPPACWTMERFARANSSGCWATTRVLSAPAWFESNALPKRPNPMKAASWLRPIEPGRMKSCFAGKSVARGKTLRVGFDQPTEVYTTSTESNLKKSRQSTANLSLPARAVVTARFTWP
jgi:hypothetical protein